MEKETYTVFKHVVGEDYQEYTGIRSIEIKVDKEATVDDMLQAFSGFLKAVGYSSKRVDEIIEPE